MDQYLDSTETIDLLPGGKNIAVTRKNRQLYAELYVNYLLTAKVERQFTAFAAGFSKVCSFHCTLKSKSFRWLKFWTKFLAVFFAHHFSI